MEENSFPIKTKIAIWWGITAGLVSSIITIINKSFFWAMMFLILIFLSLLILRTKIPALILIIFLLGGILFSSGVFVAKYLAELINVIPAEGNISDKGILSIFYCDLLLFGVPLFLFLIDCQNFIRFAKIENQKKI